MFHVSNKQDFSTKTLILEQQKYSTVSSLYENIMPVDDISSVPYAITKRPPDTADAEWNVKHQVVLPKSYCNTVLSMARETPLAGHLGVSNFSTIY